MNLTIFWTVAAVHLWGILDMAVWSAMYAHGVPRWARIFQSAAWCAVTIAVARWLAA